MSRLTFKLFIFVLLAAALTASARAQVASATYRLHKEASTTTGLFQLKPTAPDGTSLAIQSANLKSVASGEYLIKGFDTQAGVPNESGIIPAGSTVTFSLYLRKSVSSGTIFPRAKVLLNSPTGALLCSATGATALTTTVTKYTLTATTQSDVSVTAADRFYVWVGVSVTAAPTTNTTAELDIEGTTNGNYDSQVVIPLPDNPPSVSINTPVDGATLSAPATVNITASASDTDGTVSKVEFYEGTNKLGEDATSPYSFTWNNVPASSFAYSLTARAVDNEGVSKTSAPVNVYVTGGGTMAGGLAVPPTPASVNLTNEGTADWAHWGLDSPSAFDHKRDVTQQISNFMRLGATSNGSFGDNATTFSWSDGTPNVSAVNTPTGVFVSGAAGNGFELTVPADTNQRTLKLYVGVWYAQARLEATLSDNSAPAYVETSFGGTGTKNGVFTINYKAQAAGQTLRIRYTILNNLNNPYGNVTLVAATLAGGSAYGGSLSSDFAVPPVAASVNLTDEGTADWAHWGLTSNTSFDHKKNVTPQISNYTKFGASSVSVLNDNPTRFSWSDGTPSLSATNTQSGIYINSVGNGFELTVPAGTALKTLKLYLGLWMAQGKLEASLSDGSTPPLVDTSLSNTGGTINGVYTLRFKAASAGQSLKVRYSVLNDYNAPYGNVTLEAATLAGGTVVTPVIGGAAPNPASVGAEVIITGSNLGNTPGSVTFNGTAGAPTSWTSTRISVPVPAGATTGPLVVTAGGVAAEPVPFTVSSDIGAVRYVYDEMGRLVAVIEPSGETARYAYDTVGNLLTVTRYPTNSVSVVSLAPASGPVGTTVTVSGVGFSTNTAQDMVTFNGVAAVVKSATPGQLVVDVPASATTGPVSVTTPNGTASSASPFVVSAGSAAPTITSFSPTVGGMGSAVTINGTNFDTTPANNRVKMNSGYSFAESGTATAISATVGASATSGRITVSTVGGTATSAGDFFVAPLPFKAADVEATGRIAVGESKTYSLSASNKISVFVFDGRAGQRLGIKADTSSLFGRATVYTPNGYELASPLIDGANNYIGPFVLPADGTYTVLFDPFDPYTGTTTYTLYEVADITGTIAPDGAANTQTFTTPGQNANLTFSGTAGHKVSLSVSGLNLSGGRGPLVDIQFKKPDGTALSTVYNINQDTFIDPVTLPVSGTYTLVIDPKAASTGNVTVRLYNADDVSGTVVPGGPSVTATTNAPGQNVIYTFQGTAGRRVAVYLSQSIANTALSIIKPDGTNLSQPAQSAFLDAQTLPVSGTYTILIDPLYAATGTVTMSVYDVPPDLSLGLTPGGPPVTATINSPAQNARLTFAGTAGQRLGLQTSGVTIAISYLSVIKPDGTTLVAPIPSSTNGDLIDLSLPADGTYTVFLDPTIIQTGSMTFSLFSVADVTGSITPGGAAVTVTTNTAGQNALLSFAGSAGQKVSLNLSAATLIPSSVSILAPDGTTLSGPYGVSTSSRFIDTVTLPAAGTYKILVDPAGATTGSMTLTLYNVVDVTAATTVNARGVKLTTTVPGQNALLTFPGTAGQLITVKASGNTLGDVAVHLRSPDGSTLTWVHSSGTSFNLPQFSLPTTDTYTVFVDPDFTPNVGSITIVVASP